MTPDTLIPKKDETLNAEKEPLMKDVEDTPGHVSVRDKVSEEAYLEIKKVWDERKRLSEKDKVKRVKKRKLQKQARKESRGK